MASEEKFGGLKQLMSNGKEKDYVVYDEVNELLNEDYQGGARDLDDVLNQFDSVEVELVDEPKLEKTEDGRPLSEDEFNDLELPQDISEKTNDPVRMYLREMGTVPLLTREGEIELAKRIERGQAAVSKALSRSSLVIREILALEQSVRQDPPIVRDLLLLPDLLSEEEDYSEQTNALFNSLAEIERQYKKAQ
ncbi:MAG: sigma-70 factor domain-containing protein, partial [Acidobacteriota bacterium]